MCYPLPLPLLLYGTAVVLIGLALTCLIPVRPRPLLWVDLVTIVGGVTVLAATFVSVNHLIANHPSLARLRGRP